MTNQSRFLSILFSVLLLGMTLTACGGGGDQVSAESQPFTSVAEVVVAYSKAPEELLGFSYHNQTAPTVVFEYSRDDINDLDTDRLTISYQGEVIYNEQYSVDSRDGFLEDGTHLILLLEFKRADDPYVALRKPVFFVNGQRVSIPLREMVHSPWIGYRDNVREYKDGWLIFVSARLSGWIPIYTWAMYNYKTGQFIDYGEYVPPY